MRYFCSQNKSIERILHENRARERYGAPPLHCAFIIGLAQECLLSAEPDRELDWRIYAAIHNYREERTGNGLEFINISPPHNKFIPSNSPGLYQPRYYTRSVDDALAIVKVETMFTSSTREECTIFLTYENHTSIICSARSLPIAITVANLHALAVERWK